MNIKLKFLFFSFTPFTSIVLIFCSPVIKTIYGIKKPKFKSDAKVTSYAKRVGIDQEIFKLKDFNLEPIGDLKMSSLSDVRAYLPNGDRLIFEKSCSADNLTRLTMTPVELAALPIEERANLNNWIPHTYSLTTNKGAKLLDSKPKFVLVFATYLGRLNKLQAKPWVDQLATRTDIDFMVLNSDISRENGDQ